MHSIEEMQRHNEIWDKYINTFMRNRCHIDGFCINNTSDGWVIDINGIVLNFKCQDGICIIDFGNGDTISPKLCSDQ